MTDIDSKLNMLMEMKIIHTDEKEYIKDKNDFITKIIDTCKNIKLKYKLFVDICKYDDCRKNDNILQILLMPFGVIVYKEEKKRFYNYEVCLKGVYFQG